MEIEHIITHNDPEVQIRIAKFSCTNEKYSKRHIIIVPGWLSAIDNFTALATELQSFGNILIYEPRGFGESITPHKKGLFTVEKYYEEMGIVFDSLKLKNKEFILLGSCAGAANAFSYILDGDGPKPNVLIVFSPHEHYKTPFWLPTLGWIPNFFMIFIQKLIIVFYKLYLKARGIKDSANVDWAEDRLRKNDAWSLRRYVVEFIVNYNIIGRQNEIEIPMLAFIAKKDHFVEPGKTDKFIHHPDSEIFQVDVSMHRVQEGNEKLISKKVNEYLTKLKV